MNNFRAFLAISLFIASGYFIIDMILYSFSWPLLIASLLGFVLTHYMWPPSHDEDSAWYHVLEFVLELPFRAMALTVRGLVKVFKNADSSIDI